MSLEPLLILIAWGIGVAFALAVVIVTIAAFLRRSDESPTGPQWEFALSVGVGYLVGHATISEWHRNDRASDAWRALQVWYREGGSFPLFPSNAYDWLVWIVAGSTILGVLDGQWPTPRWARWLNRLLLTGMLVWLTLSWQIGAGWEPGQAARWMIGFGLVIFALWSILDLRANRLGPSMPMVLMIPPIGLAVALILLTDLNFAILSGVLAATMASLWLVSWFSPRMNLVRVVIPTYTLVFSGLILSGVYLGRLPKSCAMLFAISPLMTLVDRIRFVSQMGHVALDQDETITGTDGWRLGVVRVVAMLIPIGIAVGIAFAFVPKSESISY